jgi:hypothetical protein
MRGDDVGEAMTEGVLGHPPNGFDGVWAWSNIDS